jgi:hypothetical protein
MGNFMFFVEESRKNKDRILMKYTIILHFKDNQY